MLVAFDVDMVLVDPTYKWTSFMSDNAALKTHAMHEINHSPLLRYDMSEYFDICKEEAHSFWEHTDLYDTLSPIHGTVDAVNDVRNAGHGVVFVSKCFDGHVDSKRNFLNKHFSTESEDVMLVNTPFKGLLDGKVDVMIDDRNEFLNQFTSGKTKLIRPNTRFTQCQELSVDVEEISDISLLKDVI